MYNQPGTGKARENCRSQTKSSGLTVHRVSVETGGLHTSQDCFREEE